MIYRQYALLLTCALLCSGSVFGCALPDRSELEPKVEYYHPNQRKVAPEPVYSRVTWSHLPAPLPSKQTEFAPQIQPQIVFDLPNSTLSEAVEALAQSLGYRWVYPNEIKDRKVSIRMEGTVDEVLQEITRQAQVVGEFDREGRLVKIHTAVTTPQLPDVP